MFGPLFREGAGATQLPAACDVLVLSHTRPAQLVDIDVHHARWTDGQEQVYLGALHQANFVEPSPSLHRHLHAWAGGRRWPTTLSVCASALLSSTCCRPSVLFEPVRAQNPTPVSRSMDTLSLAQLARRAEHVICKHERMWLTGATGREDRAEAASLRDQLSTRTRPADPFSHAHVHAGVPQAANAAVPATAADACVPLLRQAPAPAEEPGSALSHAFAALHSLPSPSSPGTSVSSPRTGSDSSSGAPPRRSALTAELQKAGLARLQPSPMAS